MKKLLLLLMMLTFAFYQTAQAALLIEPYLGLNLNSKYENNLTNDTGSISGTAIGARVAFKNMGFMFGINGKRVAYDVEDLSDSLGELETTTIGVFAGYDFPILVRAWFEHVLSGEGVWSDSNSDLKYNVKSGSQIGLGYKLMPFVSLNLEIGNYHFDEVTYNGGSGSIDVDFNTYLVSISLPVSF